MSRIFISHSSRDDQRACEVRDWLVAHGWDDLFLDLDPVRGLAPGERWQAELRAAADRCEAVLFLVTPNWMASRWCLAEYLLAKQLGKSLFPITFGEIDVTALPADMAADHQAVDVVIDPQGWERLRQGLERAGLFADSFAFPPGRRPYPGFEPLTEDDAAIFFGRDTQILRGLDRLRLMRDTGAERVLVVLGASGAGKSSFLRAGLWPRLRRDDRNFWPLPVIRPDRAALTGKTGLFAALEALVADSRVAWHPAVARYPRSRAGLGEMATKEGLAGLLSAGSQAVAASAGDLSASPPTLVLCVDQSEELLNQEGRTEADSFLRMMSNALRLTPRLLVIICIRSDAYAELQASPQFSGFACEPFDLPPMRAGSMRSVVEGPARLASPPLKLEPGFVDAILEDATGQDALPLLAFTLERLAREYGAEGTLTLQQYETQGRIRGAILAAVDDALRLGRERGLIPKDGRALERLLKQAFIPHLARVNEAGEFVRRVAPANEFPLDARPVIDLLVEARLLIRDHDDREDVVEVAHEALLREWPLLRQFLEADREFLVGKRQLAEDLIAWQAAQAHQKVDALLSGLRLNRAQHWLTERAPHELTDAERQFIRESIRAAESRRRWRMRAIAATVVLLAGFSALAGWQWFRATEAAAEARQSTQFAQAQQELAARRAGEAQSSAETARVQKEVAEREARRATMMAERSDARAELILAQASMHTAPQQSLERAYKAVQRLDLLGIGDEGLSIFSSILGATREIPVPRLAPFYPITGATAFARSPAPRAKKGGDNAPSAQLTVVAGSRLSGIIDDQGRAAGRPIGDGDIDSSFANAAAWLDDIRDWLAAASKPAKAVA